MAGNFTCSTFSISRWVLTASGVCPSAGEELRITYIDSMQTLEDRRQCVCILPFHSLLLAPSRSSTAHSRCLRLACFRASQCGQRVASSRLLAALARLFGAAPDQECRTMVAEALSVPS